MKSEILPEYKEKNIEKDDENKLKASNLIPINLSDYKIIGTIGKGSFGIVSKVIHTPSSEIYASKEIILRKESKKNYTAKFWPRNKIVFNY